MSAVHRFWRSSLGIAVLALVCASVGACASTSTVHAAAAAPVEYALSIPKPHSQYAHVQLRVGTPGRSHTDIAMPAWTPGSYRIRDFSRHVYDLKAENLQGAALPVSRIDKQTWRIRHGGAGFTVSYRVFAADRTVRTSHIDDRHATLNPSSIFMYVVGNSSAPVRLDVRPPPGWNVHTAMSATGPSSAETVTLRAQDYDALVDAPLELGTPMRRTFDVDGTRFEYVLTGAKNTGADIDELAADTQRIVTALGRLMGGFPMARYVFLMSLTERGGGGLEHADSTMIMLRRNSFNSAQGKLDAARVTAHEFFHLWNVKRIHDRVLGPFDYTRENYSRLLWFHEGFTETAEASALVRCGLVTPKDYLTRLARRWNQYRNRPGGDHTPISTLSFEAWIKQYQPAPNHPNVAISYYHKGELIGVALDLEIRIRSARHGTQGDLFGMFRRLMRSHGNKDRGIDAGDIVRAASAEAGEDMKWFFDRYVDGRQPVPLPELLRQVGIEATERPPWEGPNGKPLETPQLIARARTWSGLDLSGTRVRNVVPRSPAANVGVMRDDEIVAIDGQRTGDKDQVLDQLARIGPGRSAALHLFRDGRLMELRLPLFENPQRTWSFAVDPNASDQAKALRDRWLEVF